MRNLLKDEQLELFALDIVKLLAKGHPLLDKTVRESFLKSKLLSNLSESMQLMFKATGDKSWDDLVGLIASANITPKSETIGTPSRLI